MHIIVVGYGRLGRQVVKLLDTQQHEVVVIDKDRAVLERRDRDLHARFLAGNAIDEHVLQTAGADKADVLLALTRDENTNLMAAQVARVIYQVPRVVAVVYDPAREATYRAAGIETLPITVAGAEYLVAQLQQPPDRPISFQKTYARARGHGLEAPLPTPQPTETPPGRPFYVIIVGGGRVGYFLAKALLENNLEVTLIETDPKVFALVSQQVDCPVIRGDGSSTAVLEEAGADRASVFVTVTNHDQDNLIACQIAKQRFGVPKTIARVKNPRNELIMQRLGVDVTVSSTAIITSVIQSELPTTRIRTLLDLRTGGLELMEYTLDSSSPALGKKLRELTVPADCTIVTVLRDQQAIVARGETTFASGDTVMVLVKMTAEPAVRKLLLG
ncbi:MAG: NAD-binding protein [Acidobacteria bacterium]|nr:NAD-binding protein [Acidobacteriota bacterium]